MDDDLLHVSGFGAFPPAFKTLSEQWDYNMFPYSRWTSTHTNDNQIHFSDANITQQFSNWTKTHVYCVQKIYLYICVCVMTIRYDKHGWNWNHPTRDCQNPPSTASTRLPHYFPPPSALNPPVSENGKGQKRSGKTDGKYIYLLTWMTVFFLVFSRKPGFKKRNKVKPFFASVLSNDQKFDQ